MGFLTKTEIIATNDAVYEVETVPEWGGEVRVRSLTGEERSTLAKRGETAVSWDALVCAMGIVDEKGASLFVLDEVKILAKKHPLVLERVARRILELSTMTAEARAEEQKKLTTTGSGFILPEQSTPAADSMLTA